MCLSRDGSVGRVPHIQEWVDGRAGEERGSLTRIWYISFSCPFPNAPPPPFFLSSLSSQVPKVGNLPLTTEVIKSLPAPPALEKKPQVAYKTEIIGGVVVHTPINQVLGAGAAGGCWGMGASIVGQ